MKKRFGRLASLSLAISFAVFGVSTSSALAFSGYGDGSSGTPYYIGNCAQLEEMANDLDGNYKVIRDIDCTGTTMTPVGDTSTPFTGTLDGKGFTISNISMSLNQNYVGLFGMTDGATIQNITLDSPHVEGLIKVGSLAADAENSTITKVRVTDAELAGTSYVGGIVGQQGGGSIANSSSVNVAIQANSMAGGIVAYAVGPASVSDAYATGTIHAQQGDIGGLIGNIGVGPAVVSSTYASVHLYSTGSDYGGLIGLTTNSGGQSISNSFAASYMETATVYSSAGGAFGASAASTSNIFYDDGISSWGGCVGDGSASCTAVNTGGSDPNYFKNSDANGPLSGWDFINMWVKNTNDYPSLKPLFNLGSDGAPNNNDADGDGTDDAYQLNVNSVPDFNYVWSTISIPSSSGCSIEDAMWNNPLTKDSYSHPLTTMTDFSLYCHTAGLSVPVTIIYDKRYDTTNWILRYYNESTDSYQTVPDAQFGTKTIGGVAKTTVTYMVTDGGAYDSDGSANAVIDDPVGPAIGPATSGTLSAPNTGFGSPSSKQGIVWVGLFSALAFVSGIVLRYSYGQGKEKNR